MSGRGSGRGLFEIHMDTGAVLLLAAEKVSITHRGEEITGIEWRDADPTCCPLWLNVTRVVAVTRKGDAP